MKSTFFYIVLCCITTFVSAQQRVLIAGKKPHLFIKHTVAPKENLYSIGRMYNSSPSINIAPYNNVKLNGVLKDNQVLNIPLTTQNFSKSKTAPDTMALIPLYYTVQPKDVITKIAEAYEVSLAQVKTWNTLSTDVIKVGQQLIIGYLIVNPRLSPLANSSMAKETPSLPKAPLPTIASTTSPITTTKTETPKPTAPIINEPTLANIQEDYYKKYYTGMGNINKQVAVAPFTSNAKATLRKYYVFINLVSAGTIVKVTNTQNNKIIFAQVIAGLDNAAYNSGIQMRLNDIALTALGLSTDNKISNVLVNY
jgi:LysM repeat protein